MSESAPDSPAAGDHWHARPLPVLRAMIDTLDREILELLVQRNVLVSEVSRSKRETKTPIRDMPRENYILADRRERALRLGLSPELVESLFRLVLWGSRNKQASLKAEVPLDMEPRTVAVIGGEGRMGKLLIDLFIDIGHTVMSADIGTPVTPEEAAATADVVILSVPIEKTIEVIRHLGPRVRREAVLMDVTSLKQEPMEAMLASTEASVVGTHPLFGPSVHSVQGQRVVMVRGRGDAWFEWARTMLRARGLNVVESTAAEHDKWMSIVQVLSHFGSEVMGKTLHSLGVSVEESLNFTSPPYLVDLLMVARHFSQSAALYAPIQTMNPATPEVTRAFVAAAEELRAQVVSGDRAGLTKTYDEVRDFFGSFTELALDQSSFLIDRLVERA